MQMSSAPHDLRNHLVLDCNPTPSTELPFPLFCCFLSPSNTLYVSLISLFIACLFPLERKLREGGIFVLEGRWASGGAQLGFGE